MGTYVTEPAPTTPWWRLKRVWAAVVMVATVAGIALGGLSLPDLEAITDFATSTVAVGSDEVAE